MNRRLRTRHRRVTAALALLLPVGLAAALAARDDVPRGGGTPGPPGSPDVELPSGEPVRLTATQGGLHVACRVWPGGADEGAVFELSLEGLDRSWPDVLLYWGEDGESRGWTGDKLLVGGVSEGTRRYRLPRAVDPSEGRLILYSLGHAEVLLEQGFWSEGD